MSSPSSPTKRKSPDQHEVISRKKHRNPTNYVWTPAENRDLIIWTNEFLPQVWSKASVSHANKIKNAIYPNNLLITSENVRHKINNLKAKYRKVRAKYDLDLSKNDSSDNNKGIPQEVRDNIQSEFPDYFLIETMIKRSEQQEYSNSTVAVVGAVPNSNPIYLSTANELVDESNGTDPNSNHLSSSTLPGTSNPNITAVLIDKQALILKNEKLKLEVSRLQFQLQAQDSERRKREIEFTKWKLGTEKMIAEMKLMEQKVKLILQQLQKQLEEKPLSSADGLLQTTTPPSGSTAEISTKATSESPLLSAEKHPEETNETTKEPKKVATKETLTEDAGTAKEVVDLETTKENQAVDATITAGGNDSNE